MRPFRRGYVSFVLPYRVHYVPHPDASRFVLINATQGFLRPDLDVDPLDLEDVPADELQLEHGDSAVPVLRFLDWIEPLLRRESYLALLAERPEVLGRLLRLLGLAKWPMRYLMRHPGVIDELADARALAGRFEREAYLRDLDERKRAWARGGQADEEALLDTLRRAHHAEVFRTLVRDVEGQLTVELVADDLSALADATLDCTIRWAWQHLKQRHREQPRLAVVAYGKLGGKEVGSGSDLDVVFLFDSEGHADADKSAIGVVIEILNMRFYGRNKESLKCSDSLMEEARDVLSIYTFDEKRMRQTSLDYHLLESLITASMERRAFLPPLE